MVRDLIKDISGKEPSTEVNPDECVAIGAAFQARYRFIEEAVEKAEKERGGEAAAKVKSELLGTLPDIKVRECASKSIGIITLDKEGKERITEMIPEQTKIPFTMEGKFGYAHNDQTSVLAEITEGKGEKRDEVSLIGELLLDNLPPQAQGDAHKGCVYFE